MPAQLLNFFSLIARSTPKTVSHTIANTTSWIILLCAAASINSVIVMFINPAFLLIANFLPALSALRRRSLLSAPSFPEWLLNQQ
jgi:hypothetical protein